MPPKQALFCATDHYGVGQLFFTETKAGFVVGNTVDTLLSHPDVDAAMSQDAILDYLMFRRQTDARRTFYQAIAKVPASHALLITPDAAREWRYFDLPEPKVSLTKGFGEAQEAFRSAFDQAVADRIRSSKVDSQISGGLDSSNVTASANLHLQAMGAPYSHRAHTMSFAATQNCHEAEIAAETCKMYDLDHIVTDVSKFSWDVDWDFSGLYRP